ncbi:MAG: alkaline phosphatase D family protein [Planctomycetota bacterium]|nr:alkaline phosphatase D family protein [Planctomycetota bacterium]MDA1222289.1 alkaline phosphatase D family protein [Planctomycetota bacterium]
MHQVLLCATLVLGGVLPTAASQSPLRAGVLEHADRWTKGATGARELLEEAGFSTAPLDLDALEELDLVFLGAFTNNDPAFGTRLAAHRTELLDFVARGGVVFEAAQSDQAGALALYLPDGCEVLRGDGDDDAVIAAERKHPLVDGIFGDGSAFRVDVLDGQKLSWEGIDRYVGAEPLLFAGTERGGRAALVEVGHGRGRFLVSSLWLDKRAREGQRAAPEPQRALGARFASALHSYVRAVQAGEAPEVRPVLAPTEIAVGPMVGHVDDGTAVLWFRPAAPGPVELVVDGPGGPFRRQADSTAAEDRTVRVVVDGLEPAADYRYRFERDGVEIDGAGGRFRTAEDPGAPARTRLAMGSCASSEPAPIWSAIGLWDIDGLVLLGDTPYIDSRDLSVARRKHREFLLIPELAVLLRDTPTWGTWDDHDFGGNDTDGRMTGKENTRRAFVEYRAHTASGDGEEGVYTSFRRGPLEVFLLDPRYFARTSEDAAGRPTLLGDDQWEWLERGLRASTAAFKAIACGMIWDDKKNSESDDWGSYPHERERLERFLGDAGITGAVLIGGDIHVSRHLRYPGSASRAGYPLDQLIVSPLHDHTIPSLNVPHEDLVWSAVEPEVFLILDASTLGAEPELHARWVQDEGRGRGRVLYEIRRTLRELGGPR